MGIMIATCVYIKVKPGFEGAFIEASEKNHNASTREKGNLRFDVLRMADDPCRFMLYEAYDSPESAAAHKNTAHYAKWCDTVQEMMAEPRSGIRYDILKPSSF